MTILNKTFAWLFIILAFMATMEYVPFPYQNLVFIGYILSVFVLVMVPTKRNTKEQ